MILVTGSTGLIRSEVLRLLSHAGAGCPRTSVNPGSGQTLSASRGEVLPLLGMSRSWAGSSDRKTFGCQADSTGSIREDSGLVLRWSCRCSDTGQTPPLERL